MGERVVELAKAARELVDSYLLKPTDDLLRGANTIAGMLAEAGKALAKALGGLFEGSGGSSAPTPETPAPPVPAAPAPPAPGGSGSYLNAAGSSGASNERLPLAELAVLALFSFALLQGGKRSWPSRDSLKPASLPRLAVERPG
ncbi:MAG TPA: hypothetical protein VK869_01320 [Rubrobacteraceae bacterium]|nr:hypothetical protein [Rubrobacteraceae bacterium]